MSVHFVEDKHDKVTELPRGPPRVPWPVISIAAVKIPIVYAIQYAADPN